VDEKMDEEDRKLIQRGMKRWRGEEEKDLDIFFNGVGGQGVVTAMELILEIVLEKEDYEPTGVYSPTADRRGRPIYCSAGFYKDKKRLKNFEKLLEYDILCTFNPSVASSSAGLREDGILITNTQKSVEELIEENPELEYFNVNTIDATGIYQKAGEEILGRKLSAEEIHPNIPIVAAFLKVTGKAPLEKFLEIMKNKWGGGKIYELNKKSAEYAFNAVHSRESIKKGLARKAAGAAGKRPSEFTNTSESNPTIGAAGKTGLNATEHPEIDLETCTGCSYCDVFCPEGTIYIEEGKPRIDYDYCKGCGVCADECPTKSIKMVRKK